MRPKEYFEQSSIQEDKRFIFTLIPPGFAERYRKYIKEPLERAKIGDGNITCACNLDLERDTPDLEETWKRIQRACIIIADITGFQSDLMWKLGVAMVKKERVILIAEKSAGEEANLVFNIPSLGVEYYEPDSLEVFSRKLVELVKKIIPTEHLLVAQRDGVLMDKAPPDRIASPKVLYQPGPPASGKEFKIVVDENLPGKKIFEEFEKKSEDWENIVEMYAQIKDIDDELGLVYLNCKYKKDSDETFERAFPLKHFKNRSRLRVDQSILVHVYEKPGEVRFLFEEVDEDFFDQDLEDRSINDLKDSPIFKPL